jgi:multiple sugar transport system permease protein
VTPVAGRRRSGRIPSVAVYVVGTVVAFLFAAPLLTVLLNSFKTAGEASASPPTYLPSQWSLQNYARLATNPAGVAHSISNSAIVAGGTVVLTVVVAVLAAYGLSRLRFLGSGVVSTVILLSIMVPFQVIVTPMFVVLQTVGLTNSLLGLILVLTTFQLPFAIFILRNSLTAIPEEMWEAVAIDGAGPIRALRSMLPLLVPGILTAALFAFFSAWNDFFGALILLGDQSKFTLPVILTSLISGARGSVDWGLLQAGVVVSIVPCVLVFLLLQRYYVSGLTSGALK